MKIRKKFAPSWFVTLPVFFWTVSLACDMIYFMNWGSRGWRDAAFYTMAAGITAALIATIPGFVACLSLKQPYLKRMATQRVMRHLFLICLYTINLGLRTQIVPHHLLPVLLSIAGVFLLNRTGWLKGEWVYRIRMADHLEKILENGDRGKRKEYRYAS